MNKNNYPITVSVLLDKSKEEVWEAITDLKVMQKWYFPMLQAFEPKVGFETSFSLSHEDRTFEHQWKVTAVDLGKSITYEWRFATYDGAGYTEWKLSEENNQTKLTLTDVILQAYPEHIPEFKRESAQEGWNYFIKDALVKYFEGPDQFVNPLQIV